MKWFFGCLVLLLGCESTVCVVQADDPNAECDFDQEDLTCEEAYEQFIEHYRSRIVSCGIEWVDEPQPLPDPCDDAMKTFIVCADDCTSLMSCGALDGSDLDALTAYSDCIFACPQPPL